MIQIIPSILTDNPDEAKEMLCRCEGVVERVSVDIIDGVYANNKTIDPSVLIELETDLLLDFHLMVKEPANWIEKCVRAGADRIIGHIEQMQDQVEFVGKVQEVGAGVGLAIDLETSVSELNPVILNNLDVILVMSVKAGFGGQKFDDRALEKIVKLDEIRVRDDTPFKIHDDGGITLDNIDDARVAGVDEVSIGRGLFEGSIEKNIERYKKMAYK